MLSLTTLAATRDPLLRMIILDEFTSRCIDSVFEYARACGAQEHELLAALIVIAKRPLADLPPTVGVPIVERAHDFLRCTEYGDGPEVV